LTPNAIAEDTGGVVMTASGDQVAFVVFNGKLYIGPIQHLT